MAKKTLSLGFMSGTSADGLTVCLFDVGSKSVIHFKNYPYPKVLQDKILNAINFKTPQISQLSFELGKIYAQTAKKFVKEFKIDLTKVAAAGSHGQTIYHNPLSKTPNTMQTGTAVFLAEELGIPIVYDFRPRDIAAGGTGAPLVPAFDAFLFKNKTPRILLNIGGISNVTVAGKGIKTYGFDIGPGNALIDSAVNIISKGKLNYDKNGALAAMHTPDVKIAKNLLKIFVKNTPPKSLDRNDYTHNFINKYFKNIKVADISTITWLSALVITQSIKKFILAKHKINIVEVSGGGLYNKTLFNFIKQNLEGVQVRGSDLSIHPIAKEAAAFAYFASMTINGLPSSCPSATGAKKSVLLGSIILP